MYRRLKAGRVSRDPDGRIDSAELLRAGFKLHPPGQPGAGHEGLAPAAAHDGASQALPPLPQVIATLEREREALLLQLLAEAQGQHLLMEPSESPARRRDGFLRRLFGRSSSALEPPDSRAPW